MPFVLVVNNDLPVQSVADLVKLAKERPLSYGSGGAGAFHHLLGELFKSQFGVEMAHVPYRGTLPALNDVIAGHIQVMFADLAPAYPLIQAGKVRALGVTTAQRAASAPDIAAARRGRRAGLRLGGLAVGGGAGRRRRRRSAPSSTARSMRRSPSPTSPGNCSAQFIPIGKGSPEELDRFVASETARWAKVLEQAGVAGSE